MASMSEIQRLEEETAHLEQTLREVEQERANGVPRSGTGYGAAGIYPYKDHISGLQGKIAQNSAKIARLKGSAPLD